jgi:hypothetical protein
MNKLVAFLQETWLRHSTIMRVYAILCGKSLAAMVHKLSAELINSISWYFSCLFSFLFLQDNDFWV